MPLNLSRVTLIGVLAVSTFALAACQAPRAYTGGSSVHVRYGTGPFWGYGGYYPYPVPVPPDVIDPPEPELPIAPPPEAVPLPLPAPDYGGDFGGGDFGGGGFDMGGADFGGGFDF